MGEETLVESQIADSTALVRSLDSQGDKPSAALWHYSPEEDEWRFLVAGPSFDALMPNDTQGAYQRVVEALTHAQLSMLFIGKVKVVKTDDPMLKATRFMIKTGPDAIARGYFRDNNVNGVFIKEMLVLRSA